MAEALDRPALRLLLAPARHHQLRGGVTQVLLDLGQDPTDIVDRAPQVDEQLVQIALDEVGPHPLPPTTACTPVENRRHSLCALPGPSSPGR